MRDFDSIRVVKQTLHSSLDSDLPDVTSLNLMDQESAPKNKAHAPVSPKSLLRKACTPFLRKRAAAVSAERNTFRTERGAPSGFPDSVYFHAAAIFQKTHVEKNLAHRLIRYGCITSIGADGDDDIDDDDDDDSAIVDDGDPNTKQNEHWAYELAYNTLKFQDLLEVILTDSYFYRSQQMPDDLMALVVVVLCDLLDRKFQPRQSMKRAEGHVKEVRQVEDILCRFKTKLDASLAQYRIKQNLLTIDSFLPPAVRVKHQRSQTLPLYAWVNTLKDSTENVCETLRTSGFTQVDSNTYLVGNVFCKDKHCSSVLLFPRRLAKQLEKTELMRKHTLIVQDKSRSLAACAVRSLLVDGADVLMVGSFSAMTVAQVAVQAAACAGCVYVCGVLNILNFNKELQTILSPSGCKNVKLMPEFFNELQESDLRIQKVRVILFLPKCSVSGLCNPVQFILSEGGDKGLLHGLSKGTISDSKLEALVEKQTQDLGHALSFPKVKAVVYCTCSVYPEENEQLVKRALENADSKAKALPFRLVSAGWGDEKEKFFKTEASDVTNGCFLCVMRREDPAEVETVQDILARAAAKGLLGGLMPPDPLNGDKPKKKKRQKGSVPVLHTEPPASLMSSPPATCSQTAASPKQTNDSSTIQDHTPTTHSQISVMDATCIDTVCLDQSYNNKNQSSVVKKKRSNTHKPRANASKQTRKKKAPSTHKEWQGRSRPPRKRLLHLRPSQHATVNSIKPTPPPTKPTAITAPVSAHRSRVASQRQSVKPKKGIKSEACEPDGEEIQSKELSLPPVYPLSSSHLSPSPYRLSAFSSSRSSSYSIVKARDSIIVHSQT